MFRFLTIRIISFGLTSLSGCLTVASLSAYEDDAARLRYNRDIRPILSDQCFACHGFDSSKREAGLRLDTRDGAMLELDSGQKAIVPSVADQSELIKRIFSHDEAERMPPTEGGKSLSDSQKETLRRWVEEGAEYEPHWAFSPLEPVAVPDGMASSKWNNPVDQFIDAKLRERSLTASPTASTEVLARRLFLDLIGLPPTLEEITAFTTDYNARGVEAYFEWVDRLLSSPHYGEKWGRWWLDQARYADSNGYSIDAPRSIWLYRDWVVKSLNEDRSFQQFAIDQLAGDLMERPSLDQRIATGFHRNTQINQEGGIDPEQFRIESVFDRVATTGTVFLGLTIGCAQCHDHKFDPITQKEYYQLFAFFNNQDEPDLQVYPEGIDGESLSTEKSSLDTYLKKYISEQKDALDTWLAQADLDRLKQMGKRFVTAYQTEPKKRSFEHHLALIEAMQSAQSERDTEQEKGGKAGEDRLQTALAASVRLAAIDKDLAKGNSTMILRERAQARKTTVYVQGDFTRPDESVLPNTPAILPPMPSQDRPYNRRDLAEWIVSPNNPLTSRVLVNRVWQVYFGRGIVETENDFGLQSSVPTHPELLDWLARDWMASGWSLKHLHRQIVCSDAYTRDSSLRQDLDLVDRDNLWLARQKRLRLDAELVRDVGLTASGLLCRKVGGKPVFPPIPEGVMSQGQVKRDWKVSQGDNRYRRGLYTFLYRATPPPSLSVFDAPEGNSSCTRRTRSNTPLQALTLLNDAAFFEFATELSKKIETEGIQSAFLRCTSRTPTDSELEVLRRLPPLSAARVLLNLDETVTRE